MPELFKGWSDKQRDYIRNANRRWNFKGGATQSGKTYLDRVYTISDRIISTTGKGLIMLIGNTQATIERNLLEPMRKDYGQSLISTIKSNNEVYLFGKKAYALGADNKRRVNVFRGSTIEYAYGDEVTTWSEEVFDMIKSRMSLDNSLFDGTYNPSNPRHWLKLFLDSNADIFNQKYTLDDNPFLSDRYVSSIKSEYAGSVYYKRYILGEWAIAEGLVYDMITDEHFITRPDLDGKYIAIDYGIQNPTVFLLIDRIDGAWVVLDEYYYSGRESGQAKTDSELADALDRFCTWEDEVYIDPSASSFIAELRKRGRRVISANNNVIPGIRETGNAFKARKLFISKNCKRLKEELYTYSFDDKKGEDAVIKEDDHGPDALRYFMMTRGRRPEKIELYSGKGRRYA